MENVKYPYTDLHPGTCVSCQVTPASACTTVISFRVFLFLIK